MKADWEDYTKMWVESNKGLFIRAVDPEQDDPRIKPLIMKGLAGPRPKLARGQKYPEVELKGIKDTLESIEKAGKESLVPPPSPQGGKYKGEGFDPSNPDAFGDPTENKKPQPPKSDKPEAKGDGSSEGQGPEYYIPEHVLVRILDPDVKPGFTYQYRFKVKMANPNEGRPKDVAFATLAKPPELEAKDFWPPPTSPLSLSVPPDTEFFVVNEKSEKGSPLHTTRFPDKDHTPLQVHRWVGYELSNPENPASGEGFGEWCILDRELFTRGEYIHRVVDAEVPLWKPEYDDYVLAANFKKGKKVIPLEFNTNSAFSTTPTLLVDFDGGNVSFKQGLKTAQDEVPVQVLILTPEGKLTVRNSAQDTENETRSKRVEEWRELVRDVKAGRRVDNRGTTSGQGGLFGNQPGGGIPRDQ